MRRVRVVRSERALAGARESRRGTRTPLLAFITPFVADPGWLAAAAAAFRDGARIVGGAVTDLDPWHPIAAADNLLQFVDSSPHRSTGSASHLPSCSLALRRADFDALGRFREDIPAGEDVELVARAVRAWGARVRFAPAMRVRHAGRRSLSAMWRHQRTFGLIRGRLGHMLSPWQRRACARRVLMPAVMAHRYWYIARRCARYRPLSLVRVLILSPLLAFGLLAYAIGLQRGCASREFP